LLDRHAGENECALSSLLPEAFIYQVSFRQSQAQPIEAFAIGLNAVVLPNSTKGWQRFAAAFSQRV
jgi:hypothetical protein